MDEPFELWIPKRGKIELVRDLPENLLSLKRPLYDARSAIIREASMLFQEMRAEEFAIWHSHYDAARTITINGRADIPITELCVAFKNHFVSSWDGVGQPTMRAMQLNFCYAPYVNNKSTLYAGQQYETLDIHFAISMLQPFIDVYDELKIFFDKVTSKQPAQLSVECMLTGKMKAALADILEFECRPAMYPMILRSRVSVFLSLVFEALCARKPPKKIIITNALREKAHQAQAIIHQSLRLHPTVGDLATQTLTNVQSLQAAFKQEFGMTVDDYEQSFRLDFVKGLLLDTPQSMEDIALGAGYGDHSALYKFFIRHVGCSPSEYRKYGKKKDSK